MEQKDINDIQELLTLSNDELYIKIGKELMGEAALPTGSVNEKQFGESWYIRNKKKIQSNICPNERIIMICKSQKLDRDVNIIAAISDIVATFIIGVSPFSIAVLIYKEGIRSFCKNELDRSKI